ncbi:3-isopropylmalate dehydratase small subunit [Robbsia sp. KACC 23696]|uniref:3-isopropylmalate dehydratase small subunit n=1 Tax=Robbsia sp. KACC 23696 TaxID=3149231 RepID=UPI00325BB6B6
MSTLDIIQGPALPLPIDNLDTDQIMPKQFLRIIDKAGLAKGLLYDLRFDEHGAARRDCVLNQPGYAGASILIGGANFGCGSSREHAVWGLQQWGFQAVIAPSFAEIFYSNAMNNRLLLVPLPRETIDALLRQVTLATQEANTPGTHSGMPHSKPIITIDLTHQRVTGPDAQHYDFPIGARHKRMVQEGMDTIDLTLASLPEIEAFESRHFHQRPWLQVMQP